MTDVTTVKFAVITAVIIPRGSVWRWTRLLIWKLESANQVQNLVSYIAFIFALIRLGKGIKLFFLLTLWVKMQCGLGSLSWDLTNSAIFPKNPCQFKNDKVKELVESHILLTPEETSHVNKINPMTTSSCLWYKCPFILLSFNFITFRLSQYLPGGGLYFTVYTRV